mmetsp:Transcript_49605/g.126056  ORF Transcript_49605/g.126056 Transcript_49605/m.126056 type:complete len:272 (+) Transcript_49605:333-1148(+)
MRSRLADFQLLMRARASQLPGPLRALCEKSQQPIRALEILGVVRREEHQWHTVRIPLWIEVHVLLQERPRQEEAGLEVELAPRLRSAVPPQVNIQHVLVLYHPALIVACPGLLRRAARAKNAHQSTSGDILQLPRLYPLAPASAPHVPLQQQVAQKRQGPERPCRMSVVPSHCVLLFVVIERVGFITITRVSISGHPVHRQHGPGVSVRDFPAGAVEHAVHTRRYDLVRVQLDAHYCPGTYHRSDLVEVEGHTWSDGQHPVHQHVWQLSPR